MKVIYGKGRVGNALSKLLKKLNINSFLMDDGNYNEEMLIKSDQIIVSPGIPPSHKIYNKYNDKIIGEIEFVYSIIPNDIKKNISIIGVTGTDGKSTVCRCLFNLFGNLLKNNYKIWIGGNYDSPFSEIYEEIISNNNKKNIIILEVSSFMAYNIKNIKFDYSIWTNFHTDHLNWHSDIQEYFDSKQKLIQNTEIKSRINKDIDINGNKIENIMPIKIKNTNFKGYHNELNLGCCFQLVNEFCKNNSININEDLIIKNIETINPLDHRIQYIGTIDGIKIYDDGKSTTANSLGAALNSFDEKVIIIAGGSDKGDKFEVLTDLFNSKIKGASLIGQTSIKFEKIFTCLGIESIINENMEDTVNNAFKLAKKHKINIILFSPGCASFGYFKNRLDRVEQFLQEIGKFKININ